MKRAIERLRSTVRQIINEDLKNVRSEHEKTIAGSTALCRMHDAPGVLEALSHIDDPKELAQVIEAIIDAVPLVRRNDVLTALTKVTRHERTTHRF